jgi:hypothetical protein
MKYFKLVDAEAEVCEVPFLSYGDVRGNCPKEARGAVPFRNIPEGYEVLKSYEGWECGEELFLAPLGSVWMQMTKGSPHYCGEWQCRKTL